MLVVVKEAKKEVAVEGIMVVKGWVVDRKQEIWLLAKSDNPRW